MLTWFALLALAAAKSVDQCCFPSQYSFRLLGSAFAGDLGIGQSFSQLVARSDSFLAWRFQMAGVQLNGSTGWVGFAAGGQGSVTGGYEFDVSNSAGTVGFCCRAGPGGNLEWVVPPRCTNDDGLAPAGSINIGGANMSVWSKWVDPVLKRRWSLVTSPECVPISSTGSDLRSFYTAYYDNTGYAAADWDVTDNVKSLGEVPSICNSAPLCVDPKWKSQQAATPPKPATENKTSLGFGPNFGLHPDDLLAHPERLPPPPLSDLLPVGGLPASFDWDLDKKKVTPPTDQRALTCGACWAHASAAAVESARAIFGDGQVVPLSIQQLIDCARSTYSAGCGGGSTPEAFEYTMSQGLEPASVYPLSAINAACDINPNQQKVKIRSWGGAQFTGNEAAMRAALFQYGPLTAGVSVLGWGLYNGGVLTSCGTAPSHVVLITGWGTDPSGIPYWRVRNSFGTAWGEKGFIRILRGHNTCGLEAAGLWVLYGNSTTR